MVYLKNEIKIIYLIVLIVAAFAPVDAYAAFEGLISSGGSIFTGLRNIIYPASAVGIIAVCIGGFFGNINWKWLTAIIVGLIVISLCAGFVYLFTDEDLSATIPDNIISGT